MTGSVAGAPSAAVMTTVAAVGVQRAAWLLLVLPIAGAVILLLGGKRTNSWGHLLGVALPVATFVYAVIAFFAMLSYPASQRSRDLHLYSWIPVGRFQVSVGMLLDPLSICFVLLITGVGSLILIFAVGYMANDPERRRACSTRTRSAGTRPGRRPPTPRTGRGSCRPARAAASPP